MSAAAVKLQGIDQLTGTVAADAAVKARMSDIDKKRYDKVAASGQRGRRQPHPQGQDAAPSAGDPAGVAPAQAGAGRAHHVHGARSAAAISEATGSLDNLISYAFRDDTLKGTAAVHSHQFNLDEWRSGKGDLQIIPVPPKIDFGLDATVDELTYDKLKMANARGKLRIKDQRVTLENFRMNTLGGADRR